MQSALGAKAGAGIVIAILIVLAFVNTVHSTFACYRVKNANGFLE